MALTFDYPYLGAAFKFPSKAFSWSFSRIRVCPGFKDLVISFLSTVGVFVFKYFPPNSDLTYQNKKPHELWGYPEILTSNYQIWKSYLIREPDFQLM